MITHNTYSDSISKISATRAQSPPTSLPNRLSWLMNIERAGAPLTLALFRSPHTTLTPHYYHKKSICKLKSMDFISRPDLSLYNSILFFAQNFDFLIGDCLSAKSELVVLGCGIFMDTLLIGLWFLACLIITKLVFNSCGYTINLLSAFVCFGRILFSTFYIESLMS